jgi:MFS family permease
MAGLFAGGVLASPWAFAALIFATFFLASAGASAAYLTVSEIFPMEMRALAIAFFYAVGTAVGGISGPLLFGRLIASESRGAVAIAFLVGAVVMAIGGIAEIFAGVEARQRSLEDVATPLSAEGSESVDDQPGGDAERERRIRGRVEQRHQRERAGARRYRLGPGNAMYVPAMLGSAVSTPPDLGEQTLDQEIERIGRAVDEAAGPIHRDELARRVGARTWGPGRFADAVREAVAEGRIRRVGRHTYAPREHASA